MSQNRKHAGVNGEERERAERIAKRLAPTPSPQLLSAPSAAAVSTDENHAKDVPSPSSSSSSFFDGNGHRLNLDGALYRILEYLTPSDFYTLGALVGSRFWKRFLFENPQSEYLFAPPGNSKSTKGRTHLKNIHFLRQSVEGIVAQKGAKKGQKRNRKRFSQPQHSHQQGEEQQSLNRVGVLTPQEEDSILSNDTEGYFGISFFRPGVLAVWGNYAGVFLTQYVDRLFSSGQASESLPDADTEAQLCCCKGGQVQCKTKNKKSKEERTAAPIAPPAPASIPAPPTPIETTKTMVQEGSGYLFVDSYQVMSVLFCKPYVFLGFASGTINSIDSRPVYKDSPPSSSSTPEDSTRTESEETIEYPHVSECGYHRQMGREISSLASVEDRHLVSGSMRVNAKTSEILIHWNALEDGNLERISKIKINVETFAIPRPRNVPHEDVNDSAWDVSPLAMASSIYNPGIRGNNKVMLSVGARGQNLVHFRLWNCEQEDFSNPPPVLKPLKIYHLDSKCKMYCAYKWRRRRERRSHHFVYLRYFQNTQLIVGTSKGDLLRFDMSRKGLPSSDHRVLWNCCRGGMVEAVELVGNTKPIMITAGGYDGKIHFWDWETFASLGALRIHPGQQALVAEASLSSRSPKRSREAMPIAHHRYSPVVSTIFCHERSSLVSFCRDGHLHEWLVEDEAKKQRMAKQHSMAFSKEPSKCNSDDSIANGSGHDRVRRTRRRSQPSA